MNVSQDILMLFPESLSHLKAGNGGLAFMDSHLNHRQIGAHIKSLLTQQPMALPDRGGLFVFCVSQWPLPLGVSGGKGGSSRPLAADYQ